MFICFDKIPEPSPLQGEQPHSLTLPWCARCSNTFIFVAFMGLAPVSLCISCIGETQKWIMTWATITFSPHNHFWNNKNLLLTWLYSEPFIQVQFYCCVFPLVFLPGKKMVLVIPYLNCVVKGHNIHAHTFRLLVRHCYATVLKATAQHLWSKLSWEIWTGQIITDCVYSLFFLFACFFVVSPSSKNPQLHCASFP